MAHFDRSLRSQFFLTGLRPCPYLPGKRERKLFTHLSGAHAASLHDELSSHGFRRSQNIAYRPACAGCNACVSTRVVASRFEPSRSQRRVINRNKDLERRSTSAWASEEQFELFGRYLNSRHTDGGMTDMDMFDYAAMIEDTPVRTRVVEYRAPSETPNEPGPLVAACLTDVLLDGLSLVYSFFDPAEERRSLGRFIILDHIKMAQEANIPYVYLGYWVDGSAKMSYKREFEPVEILSDAGWRTLARRAK